MHLELLPGPNDSRALLDGDFARAKLSRDLLSALDRRSNRQVLRKVQAVHSVRPPGPAPFQATAAVEQVYNLSDNDLRQRFPVKHPAHAGSGPKCAKLRH